MKFNQFTLRQLLANTDYLVGYDSNTGNYIRIAKDDLIDTMQYPTAEDLDINVQYSSNGSSWHSSRGIGDKYIRIRISDYNWSEAIYIQGLTPGYQLKEDVLPSNLSSYEVSDDGCRKVCSVTIEADAEFLVELNTYEVFKMLVVNTHSEITVNVTLKSKDELNIYGSDTVAVEAEESVWVEMQRVRKNGGDVIVVKNTIL